MKISSLQIFRYQLPFVNPVTLAKKKHYFREGLLLRIFDAEGTTAVGEIAPLPGFSPESLAECETQLKKLAKTLLHQLIPDEVRQLQGAFEQWFSSPNLRSSVKFGLEMAVLNLFSAKHQISVARLLSPHCPMFLSLTRLLAGTPDAIRNKAAQIDKSAGGNIKLKVGRFPVDEEIKLVREIKRMIGSRPLQLDANRSWDLETAVYFGKHVADCEIRYIEEPVINSVECPEFTEKTGIGYALDETLQDPNYQFEFQKGMKALVLKPTIIGGIEKVKMLAREAATYQIPAVISSSYESSLGLIMLANLAATLDLETAVGLDTYDSFRTDLCEPKFSIEQGMISLKRLEPGKAIIREECLELLWQSDHLE